MNGRVLVCLASRDRNLALERMIRSVMETSTEADVAIYIDEDQADDYQNIKTGDGVSMLIGPRIGPVSSLNELVKVNPDYDVYQAATDDCTFMTADWDHWVLETGTQHPVSAIAAHLPGSKRMDFPGATNRWVEILGWLALPTCGHFYWDVFSEVLGCETSIIYAAPEEFTILHDDAPTEGIAEKLNADAVAVVMALAFQRAELVEKLRNG